MFSVENTCDVEIIRKFSMNYADLVKIKTGNLAIVL